MSTVTELRLPSASSMNSLPASAKDEYALSGMLVTEYPGRYLCEKFVLPAELVPIVHTDSLWSVRVRSLAPQANPYTSFNTPGDTPARMCLVSSCLMCCLPYASVGFSRKATSLCFTPSSNGLLRLALRRYSRGRELSRAGLPPCEMMRPLRLMYALMVP